MNSQSETATLAGGCFWCTEAIFTRLTGVISVMPGYAGGSIKNPSYAEVCTGTTGHSEAIQIKFDPALISYADILDVFWHTHNPTTPNQQGSDKGTQYRSAIYYHTATQKMIAEKTKTQFDLDGVYLDPVVTEITPFTIFYPAEDYHRDYFAKNPVAPYCTFVIDPKIKKLIQSYGSRLKKPIPP